MILENKVYDNFVNDFASILSKKTCNLKLSKLIFLCVGTDKVLGDSFGPLVGYKLKKIYEDNENIEVIGTLGSVINMQNAMGIISNIKNRYEYPFFIAIDAALSNRNSIGDIIVSNDKMNIGSCFNKGRIYIGDISIKGIVSKCFRNPRYNFKMLQSTSLNLIMNMADVVTLGISNVINV